MKGTCKHCGAVITRSRCYWRTLDPNDGRPWYCQVAGADNDYRHEPVA